MIWKDLVNDNHAWAFFYYCKRKGDKVKVLKQSKTHVTFSVEKVDG